MPTAASARAPWGIFSCCGAKLGNDRDGQLAQLVFQVIEPICAICADADAAENEKRRPAFVFDAAPRALLELAVVHVGRVE